jgi:hypothetical protein
VGLGWWKMTGEVAFDFLLLLFLLHNDFQAVMK